MATKIELDYASAAQEAIASTKKVEAALQSVNAAQAKLTLTETNLEKSTQALASARAKLKANTDTEKTKQFENAILRAEVAVEKQTAAVLKAKAAIESETAAVLKAKAAVEGKTEATNKLKAELDAAGSKSQNTSVGLDKVGGSLGGVAAAAAVVTTVVMGAVAAFNAAEQAATKFGNVKVKQQFDEMHKSIDNTIGLLLDLPIAGKSVLEWAGAMAEDISNVSASLGYMAIQFELATGQIDKQTAALKFAKQAADEYTNSDFVKNAQTGSGRGTVTSTRFDPITGEKYQVNAVTGERMPGRAIGGPVAAGQPVVVGERRPEVFIPDRSGRIVPSTSGVNMGGTTLNQTLAVTVQAGAFMGNRADANQLGQQLAPIIERAQRRSAVGGLKK